MQSTRARFEFRLPALVAGVGLLLIAAGCSSAPRSVVESFSRAPADWIESGRGQGSGPAALSVRDHHLELSGTRAVIAPVELTDPVGSVDVAFAGGDPRGIAGIFLAGVGGESREVLCLRATGEWRYYRGPDPLTPRGGKGWRAREGVATPTGFRRLGLRLRAGRLTLTIDGETVEKVKLEEPAGPSGGARRWRVGLFTRGALTRWNNFAFGEDRPQKPFDPSGHVEWGTAGTARRLLADFERAASSFEAHPSRMGVFHLAAALEGALRASRTGGDAALEADIRSRGVAGAAKLRSAARRIGATPLLAAAFSARALSARERKALLGVDDVDFEARARAASDENKPAEALVWCAAGLEVDDSPALRKLWGELSSRVPPLDFDYEIEQPADLDEVVSIRALQRVVIDSYGKLPRARGADLLILLGVERSRVETVEEPATRTVSVMASGKSFPARDRDELARLRQRLPQELDEAVVRARVVRLGSEILGPASLGILDEFRIGRKTYELQIDDGRALVAMYRRLLALVKARRDAAGGEEETVRVEGRRSTSSLLVEVSVGVELMGRRVVDLPEVRISAGLERWKHPAVPDRGIEASEILPKDLEDALETVRRRVLGRVRSAISRQSVIAALGEADPLRFLLRLARGTRDPEDVDSLKYWLQQRFRLEVGLRDRVAARLLD